MPTIVDALVVTLGLDPSNYKKGSAQAREELKRTRQEGQKTGSELETATKRALGGFANLRREVMGLFAVFTAGVGLKEFIEQTVEADAAIGRLSHNLDMTTEGLSAWQGVLRRNGGAAADANSGLQAMVDSFEQIQLTGTSPLIPYLQLLHVSLADLKDPSETLLKIADAFHKMDPKQAAAIGKGMGLSPAMINLLEQGRAAVQAQLDEQKKIGVVSEADARAAMRLQNALSSLKQSFTSIGRNILTAFTPAIEVAARVMTLVGEVMAANKPIVIGVFAAITAAVTALTVPLALAAIETLAFVGPWLLAGAAIGLVVEIIIAVVEWLGRLINSNRQTRAAMAELGAAAGEVRDAFVAAFKPLQPLFAAVGDAITSIGSAISTTFGGAALGVARTFINFLTNSLHALADALRAVAALMRGDLRGAMAAGHEYLRDQFADPAAGPARPSVAPAGAPVAGGSAGAAAGMIAGFEGFLARAKWDRNAYRLGFGSDTITDPATGRVTRVTANSTVTREAAQADLQRRIQTEFMPRVAASVGAAWSKFSETTRAALTSIAYNYGSLPRNVRDAARGGDTRAIAAAILAHERDNGGINAGRRRAEAAAVKSGPVLVAANTNVRSARPAISGARAQAAAGGGGQVVQNTLNVDHITVHTAATDAPAIAQEIHSALRAKFAYVPQANTGLS